MAIYRERIETAIRPLLDEGFELEDVGEHREAFGNTAIVLGSNTMRLRFISDRGQQFVEVAPVGERRVWYNLGEMLKHAGLRDWGGPWTSPDEAVAALRQHDVMIRTYLGNAALLSELVARNA